MVQRLNDSRLLNDDISQVSQRESNTLAVPALAGTFANSPKNEGSGRKCILTLYLYPVATSMSLLCFQTDSALPLSLLLSLFPRERSSDGEKREEEADNLGMNHRARRFTVIFIKLDD